MPLKLLLVAFIAVSCVAAADTKKESDIGNDVFFKIIQIALNGPRKCVDTAVNKFDLATQSKQVYDYVATCNPRGLQAIADQYNTTIDVIEKTLMEAHTAIFVNSCELSKVPGAAACFDQLEVTAQILAKCLYTAVDNGVTDSSPCRVGKDAFLGSLHYAHTHQIDIRTLMPQQN